MVEVLSSPHDRLREVAYGYFERFPDPALTPRLLAALEQEKTELESSNDAVIALRKRLRAAEEEIVQLQAERDEAASRHVAHAAPSPRGPPGPPPPPETP